MVGSIRVTLLTIVAAISLTSCTSEHDRLPGFLSLEYEYINTPASDGSGEPNISQGSDGQLYLSWIEPSSDGTHSLLFSKWRAGSWKTPSKIATGDNWFVNWADLPAVAATDNNTVLASWLERTGTEKYAYGVRFSISNDGGREWSTPFFVHRDSTPTEHGFVSLLPVSSDHFRAIWLDGRETVNEDGSMTLRTAAIDPAGTISDERLLDPRVCDCCQTSAALAGDSSIIVVYRDRGEDEMRDISVIRYDDGTWSKPETVHEDGWQIAGCPVNGPAVAANDSLVAVAWFTVGSNDIPAVNVAFSRDYCRSVERPIRVDTGDPLGRVDIVFCDRMSVVACWIEDIDEDSFLMIRRIGLKGEMSAPVRVSKISPDRESGFPQLGRVGGDILLAWTATSGEKKVRTALITIN